MSTPDVRLLDELVALMREGGLTRLTYAQGGASITLVLPEEGSVAARPALPPRMVLSPGMGVFTPRHPLAAEPYVRPGSAVKPGDILALLAVGPVLTAIEAPFAGTVRRVLPEEGDLVGFEDALIEIEPLET